MRRRIFGRVAFGHMRRPCSLISAFSTLTQLAISIKPYGACWSSRNARRSSNIPSAALMLTEEHLLLSFFTTVGGAAPECSVFLFLFLKRLCALLVEKGHKTYGVLMLYVQCRLSFALLRSAIMCIRGSRLAYHRPPVNSRSGKLL